MLNLYRVYIFTGDHLFKYMLEAETPKQAIAISKEITQTRVESIDGAKITYEII